VIGFLRNTLALVTLLALGAASAMAQPSGENPGGEASLKLPDLSSVSFFNGAIDGHRLLMIGILFCIFGLGFGMVIFMRLKNLPVHRSMREISELIYETCKTYLVTQGKFILLLWAFIAVIIAAYFGWLAPVPGKSVGLTLPIILAFSLVGIAGSYGVAWFGIRVNTFANSRTAFASLPGKPFPVYQIPLERGTADHADHPALHSRRLCRSLLYRIRDRRISRRGRASNCRRYLYQDCRHRL
jgi:K(+)-stimulated pyrophosphate-energized sodium pump